MLTLRLGVHMRLTFPLGRLGLVRRWTPVHGVHSSLSRSTPIAPRWRAPVAAVAVVALAASASAGFGGSRSSGYVVRPGDTVDGLAGRFGVVPAALAGANHLEDPNRILVGQVLDIPARDVVSVAGAGRDIDEVASSPAQTTASYPASSANPGAGAYPAGLLAHRSRLRLVGSFRHWAAISGVPAGLLEATTWMESGWQPRVVSSSGAVGIGQLEPATVRFVSETLLGLRGPLNPHLPDANIRMSATYLAWMLHRTHGDVTEALGGYYQGLKSLTADGPYPSTLHYTVVIGQLWRIFGSG